MKLKNLLIFSLILFSSFFVSNKVFASSISLITPSDPGNHIIEISDGYYKPFNFVYNVGYATSSSFIFALWSCSPNDCSSTSTGLSLLETKDNLSPTYPYVSTNYLFDTYASDRYYQAQLAHYGSDGFSIVTDAILNFTVPHSGTDNMDLGFWGNMINYLFVPQDATEIQTRVQNINNALQTRYPFAYFYQVKTALTGIHVTSTPLDLSFNVHVDDFNTNMTVINSSDPIIKSFCDSMRPWISAAMWILFAIFLIHAVMDLKI